MIKFVHYLKAYKFRGNPIKRRKRLSLDYFDGWSEEEKKKADERLNWKAASTDDEDDEAGF